MKDIRIIFMGTPEFAVEGLKALIAAGENVVGVVTAPDRPAGRGRKIHESAVNIYAREQGLRVLQPTNLKAIDFLDELKSLKATLQIVVAFRMLPKAVWQMPEYGTFNLHASLLPNYRGAAPINWAVINGEQKTGVTTFFIDEKIDTGAVILAKETAIGPEENAGELHDRLMHLGSDLIVETVQVIREGNVKPESQPNMGKLQAAPKLDRDNTKIDWQKPLSIILNKIRGLSPYPVAWTPFINAGQESEMKIFAAHRAEQEEELPQNQKNSQLLAYKGKLVVKCAEGNIILDEVQLPGKRRMPAKDLLNGFNLAEDAKVGA